MIFIKRGQAAVNTDDPIRDNVKIRVHGHNNGIMDNEIKFHQKTVFQF